MTGTNYFPGGECLKEATNSDVKESSATLYIHIPSWNFVELLLPTLSISLSFYAKCYVGGTDKPDKLVFIPQLDREEAEEPKESPAFQQMALNVNKIQQQMDQMRDMFLTAMANRAPVNPAPVPLRNL